MTTGLNQVSSLDNMTIGDCIPCRYTATSSGSVGYFSELGTCTITEIPTTGTATPDGLFYFIKVDNGLLIADRIVQTNISWNALNTAKMIEGWTANNLQTDTDFIPSSISVWGNLNGTFTRIGKNSCTIISNTEGTNSSYGISVQIPGNALYLKFMINSISSKMTAYFYGATSNNNNYSIIGVDSTGIYCPLTSGSKLSIYNGSTINKQISIIINTTDSMAYCIIDGNVISKNVEVRSGGAITNGYYMAYWTPSSTLQNISFVYGLLGMVSKGIEQLLINASDFKIRSMSGGNAHQDSNGNFSLTNYELYGWPNNNEWSKYILQSDLNGKITPRDNNIWNCNNNVSGTICIDTEVNGLKTDTGINTTSYSWRQIRYNPDNKTLLI
jgi:hypothetical protein